MSVRFPLPSVSVILAIAAFFIVGLIVYAPALQGEFVTWDDTLLVVENPNAQQMTAESIKNSFTSYDPELYIPLTFISYQIDYLIGGLSPAVYHTTNVIFHILNALLVTWLLYLLLGNKWLALGLGAVFLVHPLNVESAAWVSARKDVLSTFFFLASLIAWISWRGSERRYLYAFSLVFFLLGLFSKVIVIGLPIILVMLDLLEGRRITLKTIIEKVPFFVLAIIFGIVALLGKTNVLVTTTTLQKLLMACKSTVFYLMKFIVPIDLSVMYPYSKVITPSSPDFFIPVIIVITILALIMWAYRKQRAVAFGLTFFLLTLIPTFTNFAKGGDLYVASDRYVYIPMIGLLFVIGVLLEKRLTRPATVKVHATERNGLLIVSGVLLCLYAYGSAVQAATWTTSEALYTKVLAAYPDARAAHNNLGMEYFMRNEPELAIESFDKALAIRNDAKAKANRAAALVQKGSLDQAFIEFEEVGRMDPTLPDAPYGIGNIYQKRGDYVKAADYYRKALEIDSEYTNAWNNLGIVYIQLKDWKNAIAALTTLIEKKPGFTESYFNLAGAYEENGMKKEAEEMYRKTLEITPNDADALSHLATLVYDRGDIDEAAQLLMTALKIQGDNPIAVELVLRMKRDGVAE